MTGRTMSPAALGDPRMRYGAQIKCGHCGNLAGQGRCEGCTAFRQAMAKGAARQLDLRNTIRPGGRRALYLDHLHALAEDTGVVLALYHPKGFVANWRAETQQPFSPGERAHITTPLPLTASHYLTGLHEFGHVYRPELGGTSNHGVTPEGIYGEVMAHLWAFEHSKVPIPLRCIEHARVAPLFDAKEIGWSGGPVTNRLPMRLRQPFQDAMSRLEQMAAEARGW